MYFELKFITITNIRFLDVGTSLICNTLHIVIFLTKLYKDEFFRFKGVNWIELTMWPTMSVLFILLSFKFWRSAVRSFLFSVKGITCLECIFVKTYFQTSCLDLSGKCQIESLALREGVFQSFKIYQIVIWWYILT